MELVNSKIQVILSSSLGARKFPVKDRGGLSLSSQQPTFGCLPEPVHCSHLHTEFLCFLPIANWNKSVTKSSSQIALHTNVFWMVSSVLLCIIPSFCPTSSPLDTWTLFLIPYHLYIKLPQLKVLILFGQECR